MNNTITKSESKAPVTPLHTEKKEQTTMQKLAAARYFLPVLSTIGWLLLSISNPMIKSIALIFILVGSISALTVCPLKMFGIPLKCAIKGFTICRAFIPVYGVADLVAALVGTTFGMMLGLCVSFGVPAILSIKKYLNKREEN